MAANTFKDKQNQWVVQLVEEAKKTEIGTIENVGKTDTKTTKSTSKSSTTKSSSKPASKGKGKKCPKCGVGELMERTAKASGKKFFGCNNYPKCNHSEWPK